MCVCVSVMCYYYVAYTNIREIFDINEREKRKSFDDSVDSEFKIRICVARLHLDFYIIFFFVAHFISVCNNNTYLFLGSLVHHV